MQHARWKTVLNSLLGVGALSLLANPSWAGQINVAPTIQTQVGIQNANQVQVGGTAPRGGIDQQMNQGQSAQPARGSGNRVQTQIDLQNAQQVQVGNRRTQQGNIQQRVNQRQQANSPRSGSATASGEYIPDITVDPTIQTQVRSQTATQTHVPGPDLAR
ncbi:hypothetical protein [Leptolyngbya sp. FACHB-261]|uniref:hypothetical protein n=1 Tax=Leptolyngbya sp. FACHB-261 TaxID=2692806 RepID=UPI00168A0265|nr:hypothetical protein [Leptolyngbya sp. FACHB-261]MBD2102645.1 hypothetical protein [Leptolyngbya sp. FACHB-261]